MAFDSEQRRAALRSFLAEHKELNPGRWEPAAGLGEGTLRKFLKGKTNTLTDQTYEKLADAASSALGRLVKVAELQGGDPHTPYKNGHGATSGFERVANSRDLLVTPLLMWKLVHGTSGQQGAFLLSSEQVDTIPRAELVADAKRAFSCKLLDNANAPGYRAGHTVVVDPDVGAVIGDLCIFTDESKVAAGAPSMAAIFVGHTATHWLATQNAVPGEQKLIRETYPQVWPVVLHYPHGV